MRAMDEMSRLPVYGVVMDFCRQLLLRLVDEKVYDTKAYNPFGTVYQKAIFEMLLRDPRNIERFAMGDYDEIRFTDHQGKRDKNGKLKSLASVRADMYLRKSINIKCN